MANKKITQLPSAGTLDGTEIVPLVKNGVTSQTTTQYIADLGGGGGGGGGGTVDVNTIGAAINGATSATPNDTDLVMSVESSVAKKNTWTQIKAFLKTYFDSIYTTTSAVATQITIALSGYATQAWVTSQGYITNVVTALGYTPENVSNKSDSYTVSSSTTYASSKALVDGLATKASTSYIDSVVQSLLREEFTFTSSQTFTLSQNYGAVYSVEVQGQGALKSSQYTLVAPNQITINDTLDANDYIVVIYAAAIAGLQPYYSQAATDALISNFYKKVVLNNQTGSVTAGNATNTDYVYNFTASGTLTLPTAVGQTNSYKVKNESGVNITVNFTSGQNADGSTTITITPKQALEFISNNTNYNIY